MADIIASPLDIDHDVDYLEKKRIQTLGNVRLRQHDTNEIILIPTPSNDPSDPLNWWAAAPMTSVLLEIYG